VKSLAANSISSNLMFYDRASCIDYILVTNLMHYLLFIHKIVFPSTCFEPQVLKDTVVYMQRMVLSMSMRIPGGLSVHSLSEDSS
jgi:hypothetical protein